MSGVTREFRVCGKRISLDEWEDYDGCCDVCDSEAGPGWDDDAPEDDPDDEEEHPGFVDEEEDLTW